MIWSIITQRTWFGPRAFTLTHVSYTLSNIRAWVSVWLRSKDLWSINLAKNLTYHRKHLQHSVAILISSLAFWSSPAAADQTFTVKSKILRVNRDDFCVRNHFKRVWSVWTPAKVLPCVFQTARNVGIVTKQIKATDCWKSVQWHWCFLVR